MYRPRANRARSRLIDAAKMGFKNNFSNTTRSQLQRACDPFHSQWYTDNKSNDPMLYLYHLV